MQKDMEIKQENSCWNKAKENEIMFILLSRDPAAPATIRFWIEERQKLRLNIASDVKLIEAFHCAYKMEQQRNETEKSETKS